MSDSHWMETYKSLVSLSIEGLKFLALANGGAAVAILAYLGNIAAKCAPVPDMRLPMGAFLAGLFFCGFAWLLAYLTQFKLLNETEDKGESSFASHVKLLWAAIGCYVLSLMGFAFGSWQAIIIFG